ncbi:MAG: hypothetical protein NTZ32_16265 [Planctomycetales bacterium]|nr:hypothetical protein [Planctomycetales bacterium]
MNTSLFSFALRRIGSLPSGTVHSQRSRIATLSAAMVVALLPMFSVLAIDASRPARVRFVVQDEQGRALSGVRVRLLGPMPGWPERPPASVEVTTDAKGTVLVERSRPADAPGITWEEIFDVELDGYLLWRDRLSLFPGAQVEDAIKLEATRTTLIRLRGPQGEPLARVGLSISYVKGGTQYTDHGEPRFLFTDEQGECRWRHGVLPEGFHLSGRPEKERLKDEPFVTVSYKAGELPLAAPLLRGKLLHTDGSVAVGWLVARKVRFMWAGGISGGESQNTMQVEDLVRVGSDGIFEADAETYLVVVSPDGMPLLHELAPRTWLPGIREVTVRVPEVRSVHHGQVVFDDGSPVAGLPIEVATVRWRGQLWNIIIGKDAAGFPKSLQGAIASDGTMIGGFRTDAQGHYTVPTYFGTSATFRASRENWSLADWDGLGTRARNVWKRGVWERDKGQNLERFKDVTLVFEDEHGEPIPSIHCDKDTKYVAGKVSQLDRDIGEDALGQHLFIDRSIDRVELETRDWNRKWLPLKTAIEVRDVDVQVIHVKLDNALRLLPLAGQILDPDGNEVKQARVFLYDSTSKKRDRNGNDFLGLQTTTDEEGKFSFDAAPDQCYIELGRSREESAVGLPGWTMPLAINRELREVQIRLQRGGSLKVLLPAGIGEDAQGLYVRREDAPANAPTRHSITHFARDMDRNELLSDIIRPGWYLLENYQPESTESFAALGSVRVEVKPGEQTVVDLRDRKLTERPGPADRPKSWTTIVVKHNDKVVSGAEVAVLAGVVRPEDLSRRIVEATSDDPEVRRTAITMLKQAGAQAVDAIRAGGDERKRDDLLKELADVGFDGLHRASGDLSDDTGQVRCEVETGRNCVAVARVRGRMIGWLAFVANGETVTVALRPSRALVVQRKRAKTKSLADKYYESGHLRLEQPSEAGMRGLLSVLCDARDYSPEHGGWVTREAVFDHQYPMRSEGRAPWVMEDLPVGAICTFTLTTLSTEDNHKSLASRRITIESGSGVQLVEW